MNSRLAKIIAAILLIALVITALVLPDPFNAYVASPVAISLWAIWRIIISVDQSVYWVLLIALCCLLMIRVFSVHIGAPLPEVEQPSTPQQTRVDRWRRLFREAGRSREGDAALRASLRSLLAATVRQADKPAIDDIGQALAAVHISLPPRIRDYLAIDEDGHEWPTRPVPILARIRRRLAGAAGSDEQRIDEVLDWMEAAMEIKHDQ